MDLSDTGNPGAAIHDLGNAVAKIRDEILYCIEAETLTASDPEEAREYDEAADRWDSPGETLEDKLRHVKIRRCGARLIPLIGRIHAIFLQHELEFPPLKAYRQQFERLPIVADYRRAGSWREIAIQLDVVVQLLRDAQAFCYRQTPQPRPAASKATKSPVAMPGELLDVIKRIQELLAEGCSHRDICDRLGQAARPQTVRWKALSWSEALMDYRHTDAVKTWISKCRHRPVISSLQK
jgi:hypothetical protein